MADKALLLGINRYKWISDLRGCENDVHNMARLLTETFGFQPANIHQYLSQDVTKPTVLDGFKWLCDGVQSGDRVVMHFSGHGSYIDSANDDEIIDELICLCDMDIENPDTYLLDDELGELTARIPPGVRLTVILDTCHSGTGTRQVRPERGMFESPLMVMTDTARRTAQMQMAEFAGAPMQAGIEPQASPDSDERELVYARVYEHSSRLQARRHRSPIRKFGRSVAMGRSAVQNHQLLAAASDIQTAADAFIAGDYHGAFSYHICKVARAGGSSLTTQQVMDSTIQAIHSSGFSQTPQNEGPFLDDSLFGPASVSRPDLNGANGDGNSVSPPRPINPDTTGTGAQSAGTSGVELLMQMLRVAEKFTDLANLVLQMPPEGGDKEFPLARTETEAVVYVHGISRHDPNYSETWWNAMSPHLNRSIDREEVLWSPVVNPRGERAAARAPSLEELEFIEEVEMILEDRHQQLLSTAPEETRGMTATSPMTTRGGGLSFDDFSRYMLNRDEREEILAIFDDVVRPLLQSGATIHLISHSWGTVVAWEGLRRLDSAMLPGRVANLFMVGSALSMRPVQSNLFKRITDGRRPEKVDRVFNLDARGDIVGGPLGHKFSVDDEFLGLDSLNCSILNVGCSHGSYFQMNNLPVNRDIFALLINSS